MSLKIEWVWEEELCDLHPSPFEPESTPVVRLDELRRWIDDRLNKQYDVVLTQLLAELDERQG